MMCTCHRCREPIAASDAMVWLRPWPGQSERAGDYHVHCFLLMLNEDTMSEHYKTYLGDAVYASITNWGDIVLTTEDGIRATNRIVLEPAVARSFDEWRQGAERRIAEMRCPECQENKGKMHPSHWGRATCESGSLASGGERSHCSCGICF